MKNLVIMDYTRAEVHVFTVTDKASEDEKTIEALGFDPDSCSWMVADEIDVISHGGRKGKENP